MKYPQLVPAHAVSAVTDWLVSRLENLGVEPPEVYSRLLLSLLHTPLQINALDLAELPQSKGYSDRKSYRRLHQSHDDAEALKRYHAVESIMCVLTENQLPQIEQLIDELSTKLKEIEDQYNTTNQGESQPSDDSDGTINSNRRNRKPLKKSQSVSPENPVKRYYTAFPALSKKNMPEIKNSNEIEEELLFAAMRPNWPERADDEQNVVSINHSLRINESDSKEKRRRNRDNKSKQRGNSRGAKEIDENLWDTDFTGAWEMGKDLIKEYFKNNNLPDDNKSIKSDAKSNTDINANTPIQEISHHMNELMENEDDVAIIEIVTEPEETYIELCERMDNVHERTCQEIEVLESESRMIRPVWRRLDFGGFSNGPADDDDNLGCTPIANDEGGDHVNKNVQNSLEAYNSVSELDGYNLFLENASHHKRLYERTFSSNTPTFDYASEMFKLRGKFNEDLAAIWTSEDQNRNDIAKTKVWDGDCNNPSITSPIIALKPEYYDTVSLTGDVNGANYASVTQHENIQNYLNGQDTAVNCKDKQVVECEYLFERRNQPEEFRFISGNSTISSKGLNPWIYDKSKVAQYQNNNVAVNKYGNNYWGPNAMDIPYTSASGSHINFDSHDIFGRNADNTWNANVDNYPDGPSNTLNVPAQFLTSVFAGTKYQRQPYERGMNRLFASYTCSDCIPKDMQLPINLQYHDPEKSAFALVTCRKREPASVNKNNIRYSQQAFEPQASAPTGDCSFRPIKQGYADGHEFHIPAELDRIVFTKSENGTLYFNAKKYQEYKELGNEFERTYNVTSSYPNDYQNDGVDGKASNNNGDPKFILKYMLKRNDIACQTDQDIMLNCVQPNLDQYHIGYERQQNQGTMRFNYENPNANSHPLANGNNPSPSDSDDLMLQLRNAQEQLLVQITNDEGNGDYYDHDNSFCNNGWDIDTSNTDPGMEEPLDTEFGYSSVPINRLMTNVYDTNIMTDLKKYLDKNRIITRPLSNDKKGQEEINVNQEEINRQKYIELFPDEAIWPTTVPYIQPDIPQKKESITNEGINTGQFWKNPSLWCNSGTNHDMNNLYTQNNTSVELSSYDERNEYLGAVGYNYEHSLLSNIWQNSATPENPATFGFNQMYRNQQSIGIDENRLQSCFENLYGNAHQETVLNRNIDHLSVPPVQEENNEITSENVHNFFEKFRLLNHQNIEKTVDNANVNLPNQYDATFMSRISKIDDKVVNPNARDLLVDFWNDGNPVNYENLTNVYRADSEPVKSDGPRPLTR